MMSRYDEVKPMTRDEALAAFASEKPDMVCDALIRLTYHDGDWQWVQDQCISWARHPNVDIRGLAVTCLGHLARIHTRLDLQKILPLLEELLRDPSVASRTEDALDDIKTYLGIDVKVGGPARIKTDDSQ